MSGVAGIFFFDTRPVNSWDIEPMSAALVHRGRDRAGSWTGTSVGLVHRMLCTTPESLNESLPLEHQGCVITSDARLDNRNELIEALGGSPSLSDSDLILRAYERWGERCAERLLGDFAFAIWDLKSHRLFCARDAMGTKPLVYYQGPAFFVFASEIGGLVGAPRRPVPADPLQPSTTYFDSVRRLPPGHIAIVCPHSIEVRPFWTLNPDAEIRFSKTEEYAEAFQELLRRSVQCRLRSTTPVASMLSGGVDSSSVVCMARTMAPIRSFSVVSDDRSSCPEYPFIQAVVESGTGEAKLIPVRQSGEFAEDLKRVLLESDEPTDAQYLFLPRVLHSAAAREGHRVMLDGADGDVVASLSHDYLSYVAKELGWRAFFREWSGRSMRVRSSRVRVLLGSVIGPRLPAWIQSALGLSQSRRHGSLKESHRSDLLSGSVPLGLELYDRSAARLGIEARHPLFDRRLVEFCHALPVEQKIYRGWTKFILRQAMSGLMPESVRWRTDKRNLMAAVFRRLVRASDETLRMLGFSPEEGARLWDRVVEEAWRSRWGCVIRNEKAPALV